MHPIHLFHPQVFDYTGSGNHRLMGQCDVTTQRMQELSRQQHGALLVLRAPAGEEWGGCGALQVKSSGFFSTHSLLVLMSSCMCLHSRTSQISSFTVEADPTFLDYIAGGAQVGFIVAVDFTASNGNPAHHHSHHYLGGGPTQYERAIEGIGSVLEMYDTDKVSGFVTSDSID